MHNGYWNMKASAIERANKRLNNRDLPADMIDCFKSILEIAKVLNKVDERQDNLQTAMNVMLNRLNSLEKLVHTLQYRYEFRNIQEQK